LAIKPSAHLVVNVEDGDTLKSNDLKKNSSRIVPLELNVRVNRMSAIQSNQTLQEWSDSAPFWEEHAAILREKPILSWTSSQVFERTPKISINMNQRMATKIWSHI
jgi:hypothetical protein